MIITHISAENVLKYKQLELADLPHQGLITISGQNESGKSSIGETVCFALFGRTFSIGEEDDITRVIRWGETRCSVRLGFKVGKDEYELARFLDNEGNHGARLYHAGEEDRPVAKGDNAVKEMLDELLGYQFEEFVESFYLAQREITTPHPHSHAIKTMAGIATLENIADELSRDLKNEKRKIPDIDEQIENIGADIEVLEIEPGKLRQLETEVDSIKQTGESLRLNEEYLNKAAQDYQQARPQVRSAQTIKRFSGLLVFITLLATLAIGGAWYLFNKMPDSGYTTQLTGLLEQYVPAWDPQYIPQLGLAFVISAAALLVFWLIGLVMKRKIAALLINGEALAAQVQAVAESVELYDQRYVETINSADDELISETETDIDDDESSPDQAADVVVDEQDNAVAEEENKSISINATDLSAIRKCKLDSDQASALIDDIRQHLQNRLSSQQQSQEALEASLSNEQDRLTKAEALMGVISNLKEKLDETLHRIQIRDIADELIVAAARHFSQRFNKDLRELASRTLPLFTEDRYEHLHIDTDLNVRAFSSIKRDYMDLDEISSGTQRQIMLAVRLALSQELVNTTSGGDQFIFLDEPFAFFDQTRTRNAMSILPKLSEEIRQIWVIAQEFPEDTHSDRDIVCSREYDSITPATD
ncbi:AAA family ATPase [Desulfosarcina sp.]|nr:AAA family ATPase [Desulfosarcina sp.]